MARQRPLNDPRWSAPIVWRLAAVCAIASIVAYLAAIAILLAATGRPPTDAAVQLLAAAATVVVAALSAVYLVRTRVAPLFEVILWSLELTRRRWAGLGFPDGIPDPEVAVGALAGRDDELATAGRASMLAALGRTSELDELLRTWQPRSATEAASIARHRVTLDALRGRLADPAEAYTAARAIPDEPARTRALVVLHLDAAGRDSNAGRSPERELRAARRLLDGAPLDVALPGGGPNLPVMGVTLAVVGCAIPVAVAALLVAGVLGLAACVAAVGAFWLWLRWYVARRRTGAAR